MNTSQFKFSVPTRQEMCIRENHLPMKHVHFFMNESQCNALIREDFNQSIITKATIVKNLPELPERDITKLDFTIFNLRFDKIPPRLLDSSIFYLLFLNSIDHHDADTFFPDLDLRIRSEVGCLLHWNNGFSLKFHESPDLNEDKFVLVINQKTMTRSNDMSLAKVSNANELPLFTKNGYEVQKVPSFIWDKISNDYTSHRNSFTDEYTLNSDNNSSEIFDSQFFEIATTISYISDSLRFQLLDDFHSFAQQWSGEELIKINTFGYRSFRAGTKTTYARDDIQKNIISILVKVDEDTNKAWPLTFRDQNKVENSITFSTGELCFYEGAKLEYAFLDRLDGKYSRYLYFHYLPKRLI